MKPFFPSLLLFAGVAVAAACNNSSGDSSKAIQSVDSAAAAAPDTIKAATLDTIKAAPLDSVVRKGRADTTGK